MKQFLIRISVLILGLLIFSGLEVNAQSKEIDSLKNELTILPKLTTGKNKDTIRIICLNELAILYKNTGKYATGLVLEQEVTDFFSKKKDSLSIREKWLLSNAYACAGLIYYRKGVYDSSFTKQEKALQLRIEIKDKKATAISLSNLGVLYDNQGDYPMAQKYHFQALEYREAIKDLKGIAASCGNIGEVFRKQDENEKAIEYFNRSLIAAQEAAKSEPKETGNLQVMGNAYNNLALVYESKNEFDKSLKNHKLALSIRTANGDKKGIAASYNNIGLIFKNQGQLDTALAYFNKSMDIKQSIGDKKGIAASYLNIAGIFVKQNKYPIAENNLIESLRLANEVGVRALKLECLLSLSQLYAVTNRKGNAYDYYFQYISLRDSLNNEVNIKSQLREEMNYTYGKKHIADSIQSEAKLKVDNIQHETAIARQKTFTIVGVIGFALMLIVALISIKAYRQKQKANHIISEQKIIVEEKQREILDSIAYAKRIQYALLAQDEMLENNLNDHFVLFRPKDIVSGDFYWATKSINEIQGSKRELFYLAVCDSTGHGVPGAFMSLLNISFLNEAIIEKEISDPGLAFDFVRKRLLGNTNEFTSTKTVRQDGMDGILCRIDRTANEIMYAAGYNSPVLIRNGTLTTLACDKMPIGKGERDAPFSTHRLEVQKGDVIYLYTDGYADQFGGEKGKKYKYKKLNEFLLSIHNHPCSTQKEKLENEFEQWKGKLEQIDDVCILGIKI